MPFHRYICDNCGHEFRFLHMDGVSDEVACPECDGKKVQRQLPRVAVQFKGSGYYKTDRANRKSKAGTRDASDKDSSTEASSGESKDAKPDKSDKPDKSSKSD